MKRIIIIVITLFSIVSVCQAGRSLPWIELTFSPAKTTEAAQNYRLLPTTEEQTDTDAAALYKKAIQSLPQDYQPKQFSNWRRLSPDQLPVQEVESALDNLKPTLDLLSQAAMSKQCNWPFTKPEDAQNQQYMGELSKYRQFAFILDVQAKLQIAQGRYDQAKETLKTFLTMAKHLGDAPTLVQGMVGIAIAALSQGRIEQWIQSDNAPNLYWALADVPQPFVDITKAIKTEKDNLKNYNVLIRKQFEKQLEPAHDRIRMQMNHVDRKIAALQCIEALRLYAGSHGDKLPEKLNNVTDIKIPVDPVTKKPFSYKSTGTGAVLELEATEGSDGRDAVRYELKLKQ
jgi:tetratricopeptide (TPR) repeat protein